MQARAWKIATALSSGVALLATAALPAGAAMKGTTVTFASQNGSNETGTATLTPVGTKSTKVVVTLTGAPAAAQPAHIHMGSCAKLNPAPAYPLKSLMNGTSTTIVPVSLAKLETGKYAINVHKSLTQAATYVSCGNISAMAMSGGMMKGGAMSGGSMSGGSMGGGSMSGGSMMKGGMSSSAPSGSMMTPGSTGGTMSSTAPAPAPAASAMGPGSAGGPPVGPLATPGAMSSPGGPASQASHSP